MVLSSTTQRSDSSSIQNSDTDVEATITYYADETKLQQKRDPNIVDWDGEDDPEMALNWLARRKWTYIIMLATLTTLT